MRVTPNDVTLCSATLWWTFFTHFRGFARLRWTNWLVDVLILSWNNSRKANQVSIFVWYVQSISAISLETYKRASCHLAHSVRGSGRRRRRSLTLQTREKWIIHRATVTHWNDGGLPPAALPFAGSRGFVPGRTGASRELIVNSASNRMALPCRHVALPSLLAPFLLNLVASRRSDSLLAYFSYVG